MTIDFLDMSLGKNKMIVEAIVRKDRKLSLLQRIWLGSVKDPVIRTKDFNELLDNLSKFNSKSIHTQYTNSSTISSLSVRSLDEKGRNIYFSAEINDPQEFYQSLSKEGFILIDSKILR